MRCRFRVVTLALVAFGTLMSPSALHAALIDIAGSINTTTPGAGGEFANYTSTVQGTNPIPSSAVNDGVVSLSVVDTGSPIASSGQNGGSLYSVGAEFNFQRNFIATDLQSAIDNNAYLDLVISSTGFGSQPFSLNSLSVSLWRNGTSAADTYQFVYDAGNNGYTTSDALGSPLSFGTNIGFATAGTLTFNSSTIAANVTSATVRLYFWGAGPNTTGNTHLYNVTANYTPIPEPSSYAALGLCALGLFGLRRRM